MNLLEITGRRTVWFQLRPSSNPPSATPHRARVFVFESVKPPEGERISGQTNEREGLRTSK